MNLLNALHKERVSIVADLVSWRGVIGARYSVHDVFKVLHPSLAIPFPVKGIWVPHVPTKVSSIA